MFSKLAATFISALALSQVVLAKPIRRSRIGARQGYSSSSNYDSSSSNYNSGDASSSIYNSSDSSSSSYNNAASSSYNYNNGYSLNNYNSDANMASFDGFYGSSNYDGSHNKVVIIKKEVEVCHSEQVRIIQQRLAVIHETVKRIISEQICDVETQKIIIHQYSSMVDSYSGDLSRSTGRDVGYDSTIAGYYNQIVNSDGSLSSNDLGFGGQDVGSNYVTYGGSNWNSATSPNTVANAFISAQQGLRSSHQN